MLFVHGVANRSESAFSDLVAATASAVDRTLGTDADAVFWGNLAPTEINLAAMLAEVVLLAPPDPELMYRAPRMKTAAGPFPRDIHTASARADPTSVA